MKTLGVFCSVAVIGVLLVGTSRLPGAPPPGSAKLSIHVAVERQKGDTWEAVDPQMVFHSGDVIRFRFRASSGGYLYVLNSTSDKATAWLFPRAGSTERSQVEKGVEYLIPSAQGGFAVSGNPGFDTTYWILSPKPIDSTQPFVPTGDSRASTLQPRCRSEVLKSRGLCVDERAGPHAVNDAVDLPFRPPESERLHSRDLTFKSEEGTTQISALTHQSDVVVYEFTIAHD